MSMDIYDFLMVMRNLTRSPTTDWERLLGETPYKLLKPQWSNYKTVSNKWEFDCSWNFMFNILASIYFADSDLLSSFDKAIKNISELEV